MPRGVYDRSHLKAKRAATKATKEAGKATAAAALALSAAPKKSAPVSGGQIGGGDVQELYQHLASVTETRVRIAGQQVGHNEQLLRTIDSELSETISSLKSWREGRFPGQQKAVAAPVEAPPVSPRVPAPAPVAAPAPAPVPAPVSAPPLPFTPQAVQEVVKQASAS